MYVETGGRRLHVCRDRRQKTTCMQRQEAGDWHSRRRMIQNRGHWRLRQKTVQTGNRRMRREKQGQEFAHQFSESIASFLRKKEQSPQNKHFTIFVVKQHINHCFPLPPGAMASCPDKMRIRLLMLGYFIAYKLKFST